jgi:hypothetical protein
MQVCVVPQNDVSSSLKSVWIRLFSAVPELSKPGSWISFSMLPVHNSFLYIFHTNLVYAHITILCKHSLEYLFDLINNVSDIGQRMSIIQ